MLMHHKNHASHLQVIADIMLVASQGDCNDNDRNHCVKERGRNKKQQFKLMLLWNCTTISMPKADVCKTWFAESYTAKNK